jgi:hypothetical protein
VEFLARQLEIGNASCVKKYVQRPQTPYEHAWEIRDRYGYRSFDDPGCAGAFARFLEGRAWTHVEGRWPCSNRRRGGCVVIGCCCPASRCWRDRWPLRARQPRPACTRLWPQRPGAWIPGCRSGSRTCYRSRVSELERLRRSPRRSSGPEMVKALHGQSSSPCWGPAVSGWTTSRPIGSRC